jgi:hypothetical protein
MHGTPAFPFSPLILTGSGEEKNFRPIEFVWLLLFVTAECNMVAKGVLLVLVQEVGE